MPYTLVDSNVLFDYFSQDEEWLDWSAAMIQRAADGGGVAINAIIYAEVSVRFETIEEVNLVLPSDYFLRAVIPWEAAFLAGKAFDAYKRRGGARRSPLPDFFTAACAPMKKSGSGESLRPPRRR